MKRAACSPMLAGGTMNARGVSLRSMTTAFRPPPVLRGPGASKTRRKSAVAISLTDGPAHASFMSPYQAFASQISKHASELVLLSTPARRAWRCSSWSNGRTCCPLRTSSWWCTKTESPAVHLDHSIHSPLVADLHGRSASARASDRHRASTCEESPSNSPETANFGLYHNKRGHSGVPSPCQPQPATAQPHSTNTAVVATAASLPTHRSHAGSFVRGDEPNTMVLGMPRVVHSDPRSQLEVR